MTSSYQDFTAPYQDGWQNTEAGQTPVTAEILNNNYDAYLLALNTFLPGLETALENKVDKEEGKGLSTNDYTTNEKNKLSGLVNVEANPSGTSSTNLTKIQIGDSIYMIPSGGSGSTVVWTQIQQSGTKIATITIDGVDIDVYAPTGGSGGGDTVTWTQIQQSGTKIGTITINDTPTDVYVPTPIDVEANPSGSATAGDLTKLKVGSNIYSIPSGGSGGASSLSDLDDVTITNLQNGQILKYNSTTGKWENVNDTGGGGGHVIENSSGTDMAQEDNLQFIGAYLEDDSTNDRTVVNVVREMTASEYDSLSSAEKEGIIHVTDEYDFDALYIVNGVFIDTDNKIVSTDVSFDDSDPLSYTATEDCIVCLYFQLDGSLHSNNNGMRIYIDDELLIYYSETTGITKFRNTYLLKKGQTITSFITGGAQGTYSGNYRVYGIQSSDDVQSDYHIYSTDERVVGEWIDGSIIYERTFELQERTAITNDYTTFLINDVSVYGIDKLIDFRGYDSNSSNTSEIKMVLYPILPLIDSNGHLIVYYQQNNTFMITKFTIQYTKSS